MRAMRIDFISDVVCPWCAIGLHSLQRAVATLDADLPVQWHFQPFELNPGMPPEGEGLVEHLARKYGATPQQLEQTQATIRERGAAVGFTFAPGRDRIVNTFMAHRLLHAAGEQDEAEGGAVQMALKQALLAAYFTDGRDPSDPAVLRELAAAAGLSEPRTTAVIDGDAHAQAVREAQARWQGAGIRSVPAIVIDGHHLIQGGQPPEVFAQALRQILAG
jgi:predicted DsbA family dithiol-disulfide isomerase